MTTTTDQTGDTTSMNLPMLLNDIASSQADLDFHYLQHQSLNRKQIEQLKKLGDLLLSRLDSDNFPLRLQLNKTHEIRVSEAILEAAPHEIGKCLRVCRSENLDQATLMKLLEGIEE